MQGGGRTRVIRIAKSAVRDPYEARERVVERLAKRRDVAGPVTQMASTKNWEERTHRALGAAWPCDAHREFEVLYGEILTSLRERGLPTGRGAYGGWDDGD